VLPEYKTLPHVAQPSDVKMRNFPTRMTVFFAEASHFLQKNKPKGTHPFGFFERFF